MSPFLQNLADHPLVPVFYHADAAHAISIVKACYDGGMRVFEFTNRGAAALPVFTELAGYVAEHCPGLSLGIGTILTAADTERFIDAGANFVVQPVMTAEVGNVCRTRGLPWIPAGATLTEIYQATQLGAEVVKVFPGNVLGPGFVKAVKGPMPWLNLMVTGGVEPTADSLKTWFGAGVTAVGLGSQLFTGDTTNTDALRDRVATLVQLVADLKAN
ncbi:bifunctional 4-hydroxy-2-oxoglutarate aldolase/2-dehydro-3-deoxy-phosphogluconate aldolase [uncultured Fibrella sp.]|uniref:bifunctional 4-hydroxy-2-oxoglutarate aldolase/2-dehydro-3-deoxy-phosphogluconate aldolase n=1 Tax=uncultured Fibrella sp. TaxID=1284596 RepID=UPI0035CA1295